MRLAQPSKNNGEARTFVPASSFSSEWKPIRSQISHFEVIYGRIFKEEKERG
ncbi:hypothetical protein STRDD13_00209 [Streptococcus sp. DD13]|nr:hypothetical protein STRDD13_00209 [Streptococcus sp. DD13]